MEQGEIADKALTLPAGLDMKQREPALRSVPLAASSMALREEGAALEGLHSSTTLRPSTKHSGTLLPELKGTQSSRRLSLHQPQQRTHQNKNSTSDTNFDEFFHALHSSAPAAQYSLLLELSHLGTAAERRKNATGRKGWETDPQTTGRRHFSLMMVVLGTTLYSEREATPPAEDGRAASTSPVVLPVALAQ